MAKVCDLPAFNVESLMELDRDSETSRRWDAKYFPLLGNRFKHFYVVNQASQQYLDCARMQIDSVWDCCRSPLLTEVYGGERSRDGQILQDVLQLGAHPDVRDQCHTPASHQWYQVKVEMAKIMSRCRPAPTFEGRKLSEICSHTTFKAFWETVEKDGYPSSAQLAHEQHWYAVQNLCRRPHAVSRQEAIHGSHNGKTAIEWVRHHGHFGLEQEMMFLLKIDQQEKSHEASGTNERELEELKEMIVLNISKGHEDQEEMKNKLAGLKAENQALKKKVSEDLKDQAAAQLKLVDKVNNGLEQLLKAERKVELDALRAELNSLRDHVSAITPSAIASTVSAVFAAASSGGQTIGE